MKTLVVYFSLTGHTEQAAKEIARLFSADLEMIREEKPRKGGAAQFRSVLEVMFKSKPKIAPSNTNVAAYDLVVLGSPVWAQNMASPVRSYLEREAPKIKRLSVFCTEGGAGGAAAMRKMSTLAGRPAVASLVITESDLKSGRWRQMADSFAQSVKDALKQELSGAYAA